MFLAYYFGWCVCVYLLTTGSVTPQNAQVEQLQRMIRIIICCTWRLQTGGLLRWKGLEDTFPTPESSFLNSPVQQIMIRLSCLAISGCYVVVPRVLSAECRPRGSPECRRRSSTDCREHRHCKLESNARRVERILYSRPKWHHITFSKVQGSSIKTNPPALGFVTCCEIRVSPQT